MGTTNNETKMNKNKEEHEQTHKRPLWVPQDSSSEDLCPDCFKVVGDKSRYNIVCMLGKSKEGMTVGEITDQTHLKQPTVTHHLQALCSVDAIDCEPRGRERIYKLKRDAHCFEVCKIPY